MVVPLFSHSTTISHSFPSINIVALAKLLPPHIIKIFRIICDTLWALCVRSLKWRGHQTRHRFGPVAVSCINANSGSIPPQFERISYSIIHRHSSKGLASLWYLTTIISVYKNWNRKHIVSWKFWIVEEELPYASASIAGLGLENTSMWNGRRNKKAAHLMMHLYPRFLRSYFNLKRLPLLEEGSWNSFRSSPERWAWPTGHSKFITENSLMNVTESIQHEPTFSIRIVQYLP